MAYSFHWIGGEYDGMLSTGRAYKNDSTARGAAVRMFKQRLSDPDTELHVHNGNRSSWFGEATRYVGKVAYEHDGRTVAWFPPESPQGRL